MALNNLVDKIEARHPFLDALLFSDQGIGLMNIDAQIADLVHRHFTAQAVQVLSIHDSFIVDCCRVGELIRVMQDAAKRVTGVRCHFQGTVWGLMKSLRTYETTYENGTKGGPCDARATFSDWRLNDRRVVT
jgi:hypothetical protein